MRRTTPLLLACLWLAACSASHEESRLPVVVSSVLPQAYLVDQLADGLVISAVMIPPGASPASHEPSIEELRALSQAVLYIKVGHDHFPFEAAWLNKLLADRPDLPVVDSSRGIAALEEDPHLWVAPSAVRGMARAIAAGLETALPAHQAVIRDNLTRLLADIDATDRDVRATLDPHAGKHFWVFHPAWSYLAREYELVQVAIEEHGKEPDPKRLAQLIARGKEDGVRVVFAQPQFDPASVRVIADEIGAQVETLDPLAYDWPENLRNVAQRIADGWMQ